MFADKIETSDLILRKANKKDTLKIYENYWSDKESAKYMLWKPTESLAEANERMEKTIEFQKDKPCYIVIEKKSNEAIGMIGFIEIEPKVFDDCGIGFGTKFTHKGYGTQILMAMLTYLFEKCNAKIVYCGAMEPNTPSVKLQEKCGFTFFDKVEKVRSWDNFKYTNLLSKITRENFFKHNK